jgi:glucose-6-phosphate isomerase
MVGGVLLGFILGMDRFLEFLKGAYLMDQVALQEDPQQNLPLLGALLGIWNRNFLKYPTVAVIPYSQALARFPAHLQQLDMESNGKHVDKEGNQVTFETGPILWGEPGTNGQHSFFQLLHQGTSVVPVEMIGFIESQCGKDLQVEGSYSQEKLLANLFAQAIAFAQGQKSSNPNQEFVGNRPSHILLARKLDPMTLGSLLAYYEHKVAFQGFLWNINSFDQEGVQLGKKLATEMVKTFSEIREGRQASYPLGEAFLSHISAKKSL